MLAQNIMKLLQKYGVNFLNGLGTTLLLALISVSIGCVIGALVAILRLGKSKVLRAVATVYTEVIRDTPLLLQLYFFYFLLPDILPALKLSKFACITIALVMYETKKRRNKSMAGQELAAAQKEEEAK